MNDWAFEMYDWNEDGILEILDLTNFKNEIPKESKLYDEINKFIEEYMEIRMHRRYEKGITEIKFSLVLGSESVLAMVLSVIYRNFAINLWESKGTNM